MNHFIFYVLSSTEQLCWSVQPQRGAVWFSIHLSITIPIPMILECLLYHFFCFYQIFVFLWCISADMHSSPGSNFNFKPDLLQLLLLVYYKLLHGLTNDSATDKIISWLVWCVSSTFVDHVVNLCDKQVLE